MNKAFNYQRVLIAILLVAVTSLIYSNYQILAQNQKLSVQISKLNIKLANVTESANKIEQRLAELESQSKPNYQDLVAKIMN